MLVDENNQVWKVLSQECALSITDRQAKHICTVMADNNTGPAPYENAYEWKEWLNGIVDSIDENLLGELLVGCDDQEEEEAIFCNNIKVPINRIDRHLTPFKGKYDCPICNINSLISSGHKDEKRGVTLSCSEHNKPCRSVYCYECIVPWLTQCGNRCPSCRTISKETRYDIDNIKKNITVKENHLH